MKRGSEFNDCRVAPLRAEPNEGSPVSCGILTREGLGLGRVEHPMGGRGRAVIHEPDAPAPLGLFGPPGGKSRRAGGRYRRFVLATAAYRL